MNPLFAALLLPSLFWDRGPDTADLLRQANIHRIAVPAAQAAAWKSVAGFTVEPADPASMTRVPSPAVQFRRHTASATQAPWVDANGWRFIRSPQASFYYDVPGADAALAAAESYSYHVHASIKTDKAGLQPLSHMLTFLSHLDIASMSPLANIAYIDDGSPESGEFMNLLVRRNLLFEKANTPDPRLLTVKLGDPAYPRTDAGNPSILAERARGNLTDDKRLIRIYGSEMVVARLVGNPRQAHLLLLNYGAQKVRVDGLRIKVLGPYRHWTVADFDSPDEELLDTEAGGNSSEFTLRHLKTFAVISLTP